MNQSTVISADPDHGAVAFFDFDGTLTTGDTLMPFLQFVVGRPRYYLKLIAISPVLIGYFARLVRNDIAKQWVLKWYLAGYSADELHRLGQAFNESVLPTMLRAEGMERLAWHQSQGHECVLVSASLDCYLDAWTRDHGFSAHLVSSLETRSGRVTGRLAGSNCFGAEKVARIQQYLTGRKVGRTYAYGDSEGDLPMLKYVDEGIRFRQKGSKGHWTVV